MTQSLIVTKLIIQVPWLSVPDCEFPPRATRTKRKILRSNLLHEPLYFPPRTVFQNPEEQQEQLKQESGNAVVNGRQNEVTSAAPIETSSTLPSETQSDHMSTQPTTPSSAVASNARSQQTPTQQKVSRVAIPIVPIIPAMPTSPVAARKAHRDSVTSAQSKAESDVAAPVVPEQDDKPESTVDSAPAPPPAPKSWADLVRKQSLANGTSAGTATSLPVVNGLAPPRNENLGDVLGEINIAEAPSKVAFLRPRGLVNTGNMCYMNSVRLQRHYDKQHS